MIYLEERRLRGDLIAPCSFLRREGGERAVDLSLIMFKRHLDNGFIRMLQLVSALKGLSSWTGWLL